MIYRSGLSGSHFVDITVQMIGSHILEAGDRASLLLSGGSTPGSIYEQLSRLELPWDRVDVGLVDERWVDEKDNGSNAALIRRTLLQNKAKAAKFTPMKTQHNAASAGQEQVEKAYKPLVSNTSFAVLGMGTDGHVCSWFPGAAGLESAVDAKNPHNVQAIQAKASAVTGDYLERMTLTLTALETCKTVLLLISGEEKRKVFESGREDLPVSHLRRAGRNINLTILHAV